MDESNGVLIGYDENGDPIYGMSPTEVTAPPVMGPLTAEEMNQANQAPEESVAPNGLPKSVIDQAQSPQEKLLELYREKVKEAADQQQKALAENEKSVQQFENAGPSFDPGPLSALHTNNYRGPDAAKYLQKPMSPEERQQKLFDLKNALQKQRQGLTENQINLLKNELATSKPMVQLANRQTLMQGRQDFQEHQNVLKSIDNDKTNVQRIQNYSNLGNALTNFTNMDIRSPANLAELEQTIRTSLGVKGTGGVEERDKTFLKSFERDLITAKQYWESNPQDVKGIESTVQHLKQVAQNEQNNFRSQVAQRTQALIAGHESLYKRNPELWGDLQNKINSTTQQLAPTQVKEKPRDSSGHLIKKKQITVPSSGWNDEKQKRMEELQKKLSGG